MPGIAVHVKGAAANRTDKIGFNEIYVLWTMAWKLISKEVGRARWLKPVIPATQEAEAGELLETKS